MLANPAAIAANTRYLDSDLNRVFPGDPNGDREERIANRLCEFIENRTTLSLHGTRSRPTPFALIHSAHGGEFELAAGLPVPHVVDHRGMNEHTITACGVTVEIEVAFEDSDREAALAEYQACAFLKRAGALPGESPDADPDFFHMNNTVKKPPGKTYELYVENFERVPSGTAFASVDGRDVVADEPFYPILMSSNGFSEIFGYTGHRIAESLAEATAWLDQDRK